MAKDRYGNEVFDVNQYKDVIDPEAWADSEGFANARDQDIYNMLQGIGIEPGGQFDPNNVISDQLLGANRDERRYRWLMKNAPFNSSTSEVTIALNAAANPWAQYGLDEMQRASSRGNISFDNANEQQSRLAQDALIQQLHGLASGDRSGSRAQQELAQNQALMSGNAAGLAASRGNFGGGGAAMRQARQQQQGIAAAGTDAAMALQAQEQATARALLNQLYAGQHGLDINSAARAADIGTQSKGLNQNYALASAQGALTNQLNAWQTQSDLAAAKLKDKYEQEKLDRSYINSGIQATGALLGTAYNMSGK